MSFGGDFEGQPQWCKDQVVSLLVGGAIGQGAHRIVYELKHCPGLVLKVEKDMNFANAGEWLLWESLQWDPKASGWLVPCVDIDHRTGALVQRRARDLSDAEWEALGPVPSWLSDTKRSNWGWYEGRARMRDYGLLGRVIDRGVRGARLVPKIGEDE